MKLVAGRSPDDDVAGRRAGHEDAAAKAPTGGGQGRLPIEAAKRPGPRVVEPELAVAARHEHAAPTGRERCGDDAPAEPDDLLLAHREKARAEDAGRLAARRELRG